MMRIIKVLFVITATGGAVTVPGAEMTGTEADRLPMPGTWRGSEQCMVLGGEGPAPASQLQIIIRDNEVFNAYGPQGRSNSMFAQSDPAGGLTTEQPAFIRGLQEAKVLSGDGKNLLGMLAGVLENQPAGITSYQLLPSESVVRGRMFCHAGEKWCHFQAIKRVTFAGQAYEVEGGDLMQDYGDRMVRVGYAYDRVGCAPRVCVYVCEANLESE